MADDDRDLSLSNLQPASPRKARKRIGRGQGSGHGRYSGRGIKGQKSRAGSHTMRAGFEGGQMPIYMRLGKQRGATSKDAMPIGPFRTATQGVNVRELERVFDAGAEVTPDALKEKGLIRTTRIDVKILGDGELTKKLTVSAHRFSQSAREKIEAAGGTVTSLREEPAEQRSRKSRKIAAAKRAAGISTVKDIEEEWEEPTAEAAPEEPAAEEPAGEDEA